jgi:hypothetical protein
MKPLCIASLIILAAVFGTTFVRAQSLTAFLRDVDLFPLAQGGTVDYLEAQSTSETADTDIDSFNDFFLVSGTGKLIVNFDRELRTKGEKVIEQRHAYDYSNHDIPVDLKVGFSKIKQYFSLGNVAVSNVVIYMYRQSFYYD